METTLPPAAGAVLSAPQAGSGPNPLPQRVALGLLGLAAVGALCVAPWGLQRFALPMATLLPIATMGTALITAPLLLAAGPILRVPLEGEDVVDALGEGVAYAGRLAWAVVPMTLFLVATSDVGGFWLAFLAGLNGVLGLGVAQRALLASADRMWPTVRVRVVLWGWRVLATLIGARLLVMVIDAWGMA